MKQNLKPYTTGSMKSLSRGPRGTWPETSQMQVTVCRRSTFGRNHCVFQSENRGTPQLHPYRFTRAEDQQLENTKWYW